MARKGIRKYPRVKVAFRVECALGDRTFQGQAAMLGGGGLFLETKEGFPLGTKLMVRFRPARHLPHIRAEASVREVTPGRGLALEFTEISPEHRFLLLRLIHHKTNDRRKFPRANLAAQIRCEDFLELAFARDVSHGGMFIETKQALPVGSRVQLRFNLPDEGPIVVAAADVTYEVSDLGVGIQFVDIAPADLKRIDAYVTRAEPAPLQASSARRAT